MTRVFQLHAIESGIISQGRSLHIPLHRHRQLAEWLWMESGELELTVGCERFRIGGGALVLMPPGSWCALSFPSSVEQRFHQLVVSLPAAAVNEKLRYTYTADPAFLASLFEELARDTGQANTAQSRKAQLLLDWLWLAATEQEAEPIQASANSKMTRILHGMEETCHLPFSLAATAQAAGLSKFHFIRHFKETCGKTPLQFVISCHMDRAKHLLLTTAQTVPDIAGLCGYKSATQFHAAFTRYTGMTPKRFRDRQNMEAGQ